MGLLPMGGLARCGSEAPAEPGVGGPLERWALRCASQNLSAHRAGYPCSREAPARPARRQDLAPETPNHAGVSALILNADDLGASDAVNAAVRRAHIEGILRSASLMVAERAASDAVELARELPSLDVGLHVALSCGRPASPPGEIRALVGPDGRFPDDPARSGLRAFFDPSARAQVRREVRAQFDAYEKTGLPCSHVDGHQHLHLHPVIWDAVVCECSRLGARWIRVPFEPFRPQSPGRTAARRMEWLFFRALRPRCLRSARRAGLRVADRVHGHLETGRMTADYVAGLIRQIECAVTEIYFHPGAAPDDVDLRTLLDPGVRAEAERRDLRLTGFRDLA